MGGGDLISLGEVPYHLSPHTYKGVKMQGIYKIINRVNGKYYVGSTNDFDRRWIREHLPALRKKEHGTVPLQRAWNTYGEENFIFQIEEEMSGDRRARIECEQVYLDKGFELGILYNVARAARGGDLGEEVNQKRSKANTGKKRSEETRAKMSEALLGEKNPMYGRTGKDNPMYGKHHTEEARAKMCKAQSGKNNPMYGKHHTEETITKMSEVKRGEKNPRYGKDLTEEARSKIVKPYPAFFNEITGELIPIGKNLFGMCRERKLTYDKIYNLKIGATKNRTRDGWRLATEEEANALSVRA